MCFRNDDCWEASVCEVTRDTVKDINTHCVECDRTIAAGVPHTHVYLQEHCPDDWDAEADENGLDDDGNEFNPGLTEEFDRCHDCDRLLQAIEAAELEEGCGRDEAQPATSRLRDAMWEDTHREGRRYIVKARAMFPELSEAYLAMMTGEVADE